MTLVDSDRSVENVLIGDLELPEGWAPCQVKDIAAIHYGKALKEADREGGPVPVYGSNGVVGSHNAALTSGPTIIVGRKGSVGAIHESPVACWPIDTTYFIHRFEIDNVFLAYALRSLNLAELDTSTAIPGLNREDIYRQIVALPPLAEQQRIVAKVEELLARVNASRERLRRVPTILKRFRQGVLSAACSGRLIVDWPEEHPPKGSQSDKGLPDGWRWTTVAELASKSPGSIQSGPFGSNLHHSEFQRVGVLAIGIDNVADGDFSLGKQHRISQSKHSELERYAARPLDVLITVMATVGKCCVVPKDLEAAIITKHVYRITADQQRANPYYLMHALRSDAVQRQIVDQVIGQTRPGINGRILKALRIPTPPLGEQDDIVRRVDALFGLAAAIERRIGAAAVGTDQLTQSILAKAFRGELVPTEAELARRESRDYESASALLERIQREPPRKR